MRFVTGGAPAYRIHSAAWVIQVPWELRTAPRRITL